MYKVMKMRKFTESLEEPNNIEPIFYRKYQTLDGEINAKVYDLVKKYGEESDISNDKVLKVSDNDFYYNLGGGFDYIVEIKSDGFISNDGKHYSFETISMENLCSLLDYLIAKYEK